MKCIYKNKLGANGEIIAKNYLLNKNYKFIKNNYRYERAEVDLIFEDEVSKMILFIEVKTRRNKKYGEPEESITFIKQEHIKKAATGFINDFPEFSNHDLRIDVISIIINEGNAEINHIENAF